VRTLSAIARIAGRGNRKRTSPLPEEEADSFGCRWLVKRPDYGNRTAAVAARPGMTVTTTCLRPCSG
jgi:hypothetical protein